MAQGLRLLLLFLLGTWHAALAAATLLPPRNVSAVSDTWNATTATYGVAYGKCDSSSAERLNEGYCVHRYKDSKGIWTIGIGYNLMQGGASSAVASCGGSYNAIMQGPDSCSDKTAGQTLSDSVIQCLFEKSIASARACPMRLVSGFDSLPSGPKSALADMAYNMGCATLGTFKNTLAYVAKHDWSNAAMGMQNSLWCGQVHSRCTRDVACMKSGGISGL